MRVIDMYANELKIHDYVLHGPSLFRITRIKENEIYYNVQMNNGPWASSMALKKVSEQEAMYYLLAKGS